jgi:hypothetical protein
MNPTSKSPAQTLVNELMVNAAEPIPFTIPLDRPEPQPQQSPSRLELEPQPVTEPTARNF